MFQTFCLFFFTRGPNHEIQESNPLASLNNVSEVNWRELHKNFHRKRLLRATSVTSQQRCLHVEQSWAYVVKGSGGASHNALYDPQLETMTESCGVSGWLAELSWAASASLSVSVSPTQPGHVKACHLWFIQIRLQLCSSMETSAKLPRSSCLLYSKHVIFLEMKD